MASPGTLDSHNGILGIRANTNAYDPNYATAYVHNWFLGVQRELRPGWILELDYLGSAINWNQSSGNSIYNAGTAHLRRPFAKGFTFEAIYTMSRGLADSEGQYQDALNRAAERAVTNFDASRRGSLKGVWEIPS